MCIPAIIIIYIYKVLGQVDNKFIACLIKPQPTGDNRLLNYLLFIIIIIIGSHNLLVLFDQHAVHERIRLEILTQGMYISVFN